MIEKQHQELYAKRRRYKERYFDLPWHRRIGKRLEEFNKRLTVSLLGKLLRITPHKKLQLSEIKSVLIIRNDAIGDMVLATPVWRVLKSLAPHIRIGVAGSFRNLSVIRYDPDVDVTFDCSESSTKQVVRGAIAARKEKWDLVIPMIYNRKTKMAILSRLMSPHGVTSMLVMRTDPKDRYDKLFSININSPYENGEVPMIELFKDHLEGCIDISIPSDHWHASLVPLEEAIGIVHQRIATILAPVRCTQYIHINLEAKTHHREYGVEHTLEVSRKLLELYPTMAIVWTSSPSAASTIEDFLRTQHEPRIQFIRTADIHELIGVVRGSVMVISPDTSVIHIASAEQKPTVGLFYRKNEWPPYKVPHHLLVPELGEAVSTIPVQQVVDAVTDLLHCSVEVKGS